MISRRRRRRRASCLAQIQGEADVVAVDPPTTGAEGDVEGHDEWVEAVAWPNNRKLGWTPGSLPPGIVWTQEVVKGGWAAAHGIHVGDELVYLNGEKVADLSQDEFMKLMMGRPLQMRLLRCLEWSEDNESEHVQWHLQHPGHDHSASQNDAGRRNERQEIKKEKKQHREQKAEQADVSTDLGASSYGFIMGLLPFQGTGTENPQQLKHDKKQSSRERRSKQRDQEQQEDEEEDKQEQQEQPRQEEGDKTVERQESLVSERVDAASRTQTSSQQPQDQSNKRRHRNKEEEREKHEENEENEKRKEEVEIVKAKRRQFGQDGRQAETTHRTSEKDTEESRGQTPKTKAKDKKGIAQAASGPDGPTTMDWFTGLLGLADGTELPDEHKQEKKSKKKNTKREKKEDNVKKDKAIFEVVAENYGEALGFLPSAMPPERVFVSKIVGDWSLQQGIQVGDELVKVMGRRTRTLEADELKDIMRKRPLLLTFHRGKPQEGGEEDAASPIDITSRQSSRIRDGRRGAGVGPEEERGGGREAAEEVKRTRKSSELLLVAGVEVADLGFWPSGYPPDDVHVERLAANSWCGRHGIVVGDQLRRVNGMDVSTLNKMDLKRVMRSRLILKRTSSSHCNRDQYI